MNMLDKIQKREQKREIIRREINAGRIFSVHWTKDNGELAKRTFTKKTYVPTGTSKRIPKPYHMSITETLNDNGKKKWSTINLDTTELIKAAGKEYRF